MGAKANGKLKDPLNSQANGHIAVRLPQPHAKQSALSNRAFSGIARYVRATRT